METSFVEQLELYPRDTAWYVLFLEHLDEFATLAWYLAADSQLVERIITRTMSRLDRIPFDEATPSHSYTQAQEVLIAQALAVLGLEDAGVSAEALSF
jgi:hypothetical protein